MNRENFLYDIVDVDNGSLQYTHYGEGQFYKWHQDSDLVSFIIPQIRYNSGDNKAQDQNLIAGEYIRKLSFTLQLSEPDEYEGGEFDLEISGPNAEKRFETMKMPKGSIVVFPSYMWHRVRPVTSGVRKSLVGWIMGPPFR